MFDLKIKILIVDDLPEITESIITFCKQIGFTNLTTALNGKQAWNEIQTANPPFDLILSDWSMPQMSGLELLKHARADDRYSQTPFLMITGQGETMEIVEALRAGATNYLVKPFTYQSLKEKLELVHSGYPDSLPELK